MLRGTLLMNRGIFIAPHIRQGHPEQSKLSRLRNKDKCIPSFPANRRPVLEGALRKGPQAPCSLNAGSPAASALIVVMMLSSTVIGAIWGYIVIGYVGIIWGYEVILGQYRGYPLLYVLGLSLSPKILALDP